MSRLGAGGEGVKTGSIEIIYEIISIVQVKKIMKMNKTDRKENGRVTISNVKQVEGLALENEGRGGFCLVDSTAKLPNSTAQ